MPPLLVLQGITLNFGASPLLSGAALAIAAADRICLVGRNGSGKSTLLLIAAGLPSEQRRSAVQRGRDALSLRLLSESSNDPLNRHAG